MTSGREQAAQGENAVQDGTDGELPLDDLQAMPEPSPESGLRMAEALLFASRDLLSVEEIAARLPAGTNVRALIDTLRRAYATRGVNVVEIGGKFGFRTAEDLAYLLARESLRSSPITSR